MTGTLAKAIALLLCLSFWGCSSPTLPPEVKLAKTQEHSLWRAGAEAYTPEDYNRYKEALQEVKSDLIKQEVRLSWFRDYAAVESRFREILKQGEGLLRKVQEEKKLRAESTEQEILVFQEKLQTLKRLSAMINEGRLSRADITKAELALAEAQTLHRRGHYPLAEEKLSSISDYITSGEEAIRPILSRFTDRALIAKWQGWVQSTVAESKAKGSYAIVITKVNRRLTVYRNGAVLKTYEINIGRRGSLDKVHAGDHATPEGRYSIVKKLPRSRYYKALLINYPNEEDLRQFLAAKKKGIIPASAKIGGLIEIHGGGKEGMTYGCVSLENRHMDELYGLVDTGTPVTIVGVTEYQNSISSELRER
ncbi:MAG: L,D-transpeptidase [Thermodesulfovibrionales bacterium]|nr:L,D-transpeptidase [Thermodesulfovibrionales bacterium]